MRVMRLVFLVAVAGLVNAYPRWFKEENPDLNPLDRILPSQIKIGKPFPWGTLSVTPDVLEEVMPFEEKECCAEPKGGAYLTVSWKSLFPHKEPYWVGMYLDGDDVQSVVPVKFMYVSNSSGKFRASGKMSFWAINMRKKIVFNLFKGDPETSTLVATSNTVTLRTPNEPTGGRLSHTQNASEMKISWITGSTENQSVQWGMMQGKLDMSAAAIMTTYSRTDMCGGVAKGQGFRDPGLLWSATMTGLPPGVKVHYRYGSDADGWSQPLFFNSKPGASSKVKFFMTADLGSHSPDDSEQEWDSRASRNTTDLMFAESYGKSLALHIGDISYAVGYASRWDDFHDQISPIATRMPWMTAIGNHEKDWPGSAIGTKDSGGECGVPYDMRFPMPGTARDVPWYSFDHGPVHFCVISSEHDFDDQYPWVLKDLASVNRTLTPWVVVAVHRPVYISSTNFDPIDGDQTIGRQFRDAFEELLYIAEVDLVATGHHHSYQRTCLGVYKGQCVTPAFNGSYAGPTYVVVGMGGFASCTNIQKPQPPIFEIVDATHHGYTRVTADSTSFKVEYVRGDDGLVHDTFMLEKIIASR